MRTLLHAPRTRRRSIAAATLGALALVGSILVATRRRPSMTLVLVACSSRRSGRALDTLNGTGGFSTRWRRTRGARCEDRRPRGDSGRWVRGCGVVDATVSGTPSAGTLFGRRMRTRRARRCWSTTTTLGSTSPTVRSSPVSSAGTIQVSTETAARLILDVQGYTPPHRRNRRRRVRPRSGQAHRRHPFRARRPKALLARGRRASTFRSPANGVPAGASGAVVTPPPDQFTARTVPDAVRDGPPPVPTTRCTTLRR